MVHKRSILIAFAVLVVFALPQLVSLYTEFLWFDAQGLASVFFTTLNYQLAVFFSVAVFTAVALVITLKTTERIIKKKKKDYQRSGFIPSLIGLVTLFIAMGATSQWEIVLRYLNPFSFSQTDPVFSQDISFYVYTLPFFDAVITLLFSITFVCAVLALALYAIHFRKKIILEEDQTIIHARAGFDFAHYVLELKKYAYVQLSVFGAILLALTATRYWFGRYELLFSGQGTVYGVGFTEALVRLPALWILTIVCAVGAVLLLVNIKTKKDKIVTGVVIAFISVSLLAGVAGIVVQALVVEPDEINKEREYIQHEITFTRAGFALDRVVREEITDGEGLTQAVVNRHRPTLDNARLWDDRPLLQTLNEIQIFRTYYTFPNIDVDRYDINGERRLMMLAGREIDISGLEPRSRTWVNRHLVYTHGFGLAMAPASEITNNNLPNLAVQDIPPQSSIGINITQPRIYYGENTYDYAIVNTLTAELDYPAGDENVRINYPGDGGVLLDGIVKRAAFALSFRAPQILFSDSITPESRIQYHRQVSERVQTLAPFLVLDNDPYLVVSESGELYWIQDAYTVTNRYPYSNPIRFNGHQTNYVRNSVKAVVNAFDGEVTMYVVERNDPLINTYQKAYPDLFTSINNMPQDLRAHTRYPQDIFAAQTERYRDYHMQDPEVFYNREDSWRIPNEVVRGREQMLRPYYQVMQLPGEVEAEFIQVQPFIPRGRENLIGWMAARSDGEHYGEIKAYHFSKQELTFGPMQIESRIDQDTDISQQITLWSRAGSGVVRGNLLVIPIEDTILYVEPLFLEAREQGALPQLMRIIVVHQDRIAMAPTLEIALQAVLDPDATPVVVDSEPSVIVDEARIQEIRDAYRAARVALERGDFALYAERIEALEDLLE